MEELLQRAQQLQLEQQSLFEELETMQQQNQHQVDQYQVYDRSKGEIPSDSYLRSEFERLLGLRPTHRDPLDAKSVDEGQEEAEALSREIEEGRATIRAPEGQWEVAPEDPEQFLRRLNASIEDFERRLMSKKEQRRWKRQKKKERMDDDDGGDDTVLEEEFQFTLNDDDTKEESSSFNVNSVFEKELTTSVPVPDIPPAAAAQFERAERVLLVLRRVFMNKRIEPTDVLDALIERQLIVDRSAGNASQDEVLQFEDPWVVLQGLDRVYTYLQLLGYNSGIRMDIIDLFSSYYEYKPEVRARIIAHVQFFMPLPDWYIAYTGLHGQPDPPPPPPGAPRRRPGDRIKIELGGEAENDEDRESLVDRIYPRRPPSTCDSDSTNNDSERYAYVRWMGGGTAPPIASCGNIVHVGRCHHEVEEENGGEGTPLLVLGGMYHPNTHTYHRNKQKYTSVLQYSVDAMLSLDVSSSGYYFHPPAPPHPLPDILPREGEPDLDKYPITPDEAEFLLRKVMGDDEAKWREFASQIPPKKQGQEGDAQLEEGAVQVATTWAFEINPFNGKVESIGMDWGWVGGAVPDIMDVYDMYALETGILTEEVEDALFDDDDHDDD